MVLLVNGKHALITGAGSGINLAFARLLLEEGCSVMIVDLNLRPEAETLLHKYPHPSAEGMPSVFFHKSDVASWEQLSTLWRAALEAFPTVDLVVPGAGLYDPPWSNFWMPPITETNPNSVSRDLADANPGHYAVLDVNLVSPIRLSQLAIGHWTQTRQKGCLVYVGSLSGYIPNPEDVLYCVSKHGLHGFVKGLGGLRDKLGIRIGCVAPGPVKTRLWDDYPARSEVLLADCRFIPEQEVAQAMLELVVNEEYGDGTILEVTPWETRVVPRFDGVGPNMGSIHCPGLQEHTRRLFADLRAKGLSV